MFYKIYSNNELFKIPGFKPGILPKVQYAFVETGGSFTLKDGDILHIDPKWSTIDVSGDGENLYQGIVMSLESGSNFCAYYIDLEHEAGLQTGYNWFWEDVYPLYNIGNILKIYKLDEEVGDPYEFTADGSFSEESVIARGCYLAGVLTIVDDSGELKWKLLNPSSSEFAQYDKNVIQLESFNDAITISGIAMVNWGSELGVCYTLDSGIESFGFYYSDFDAGLETFNRQTYLGLFGGVIPKTGDIITIYRNAGGIDYSVFNEDGWNDPDAIIENIETVFGSNPIVLEYNGYKWQLITEGTQEEDETFSYIPLWYGQDRLSISKGMFLEDRNEYGVIYTLESGRDSGGLYYKFNEIEDQVFEAQTSRNWFGVEPESGDQVHIYTFPDGDGWYDVTGDAGYNPFRNMDTIIAQLENHGENPTIVQFDGAHWTLIQEGNLW